MKKFDKMVMATIDKMANKDTWSDVDWEKLQNKLFKSKDTPGKYRNTILCGPESWLKFVQRYSMNKVNIDPKWLQPNNSNPKKPANNKEHFTMKDVFMDALKEIEKENKNVTRSSAIS